MKRYRSIFILSLVVILFSCSNKRFAYRKTVAVDTEKSIVLVKKTSKANVTEVKTEDVLAISLADKIIDSISVLHEKPIIQTQQKSIIKAYTFKPITLQEDTLKKKKYNFDTESEQGTGTHDTYAIFGFVLTLLGFLVGLTFIPGLILSIMGLKSKKYKGFAIAGIVISAVVILLLVLFLILLIQALRNWN